MHTSTPSRLDSNTTHNIQQGWPKHLREDRQTLTNNPYCNKYSINQHEPNHPQTGHQTLTCKCNPYIMVDVDESPIDGTHSVIYSAREYNQRCLHGNHVINDGLFMN